MIRATCALRSDDAAKPASQLQILPVIVMGGVRADLPRIASTRFAIFVDDLFRSF